MNVLLNYLPFQNFISVTSFSASSSVCTLSCLGVRVMRYGSGLRDDSPLYPSRDMGSSGSDPISKAHNNREMARHNSRSATWMAGQMRRLRHIRTKSQRGKTGDGWQNAGEHFVRTPRRTSNGPGPLRWGGCSIQHKSMCRLGSAQV
jgi:hypothetical protein